MNGARVRWPANCDIVTIAPPGEIEQPLFTSGGWGVEGLRLHE